MGSVINVTQAGYSEHESVENWATVYARRTLSEHKEAVILDHPDGSVTEDKLSGDVKEKLADAVAMAQTVTETANTAKTIAQTAKASADNAVSEAENAYEKSLDAYSKADNAVLVANTAKAKSEASEQRAISAETKADAAVASASAAVQKAETAQEKADTAQSDMAQHSSDTDIHTTAGEKAIWNSAITCYPAIRIYAQSDNVEHGLTTTVYSVTVPQYEGKTMPVGFTMVIVPDENSLYEEDKDNLVCLNVNGSYDLPIGLDRLYANKSLVVTLKHVDEEDPLVQTWSCDSATGKSIEALKIGTMALSVAETKADKVNFTASTEATLSFEFSTSHNNELRAGELTTLSFTFGNGEYPQDYISGISFDSGSTPTAIDYTDSGILNWVGTDCATSDGLSIFQPSANTHYDVVFYFNGVQFIGLVNGFVPATGNEAV